MMKSLNEDSIVKQTLDHWNARASMVLAGERLDTVANYVKSQTELILKWITNSKSERKDITTVLKIPDIGTLNFYAFAEFP